jgi:hypothetical protein
MSLRFDIGKGDTSPSLDFVIEPASISLTGATAIFRWRPANTETWVNSEPAIIATATVTPKLRYEWQAGDTNTPGLYEAQFVVTYADNTTETFPNAALITISVNGLETADARRIAEVRFLVGDTDNTLASNDILFALGQTSNVYSAAALCARALSARYARRVDTKFETVESRYSQLRDSYEQLARSLDTQARRYAGLGMPLAGGITQSDVDSAHSDLNRVPAFFRDNMFSNSPPSSDV